MRETQNIAISLLILVGGKNGYLCVIYLSSQNIVFYFPTEYILAVILQQLYTQIPFTVLMPVVCVFVKNINGFHDRNYFLITNDIRLKEQSKNEMTLAIASV